MEISEIIALAGILATAIIAVISILIQGKRQKEQEQREEKLHQEQLKKQEQSHLDQLKREDEIRKLNKEDQAHIEFSLYCNFFGPEDGQFLTEVNLMAENKGNRLQLFPEIMLRIRGIKKNESLSLYGKLQNVNFPHKVLEEINIIDKENLNFYFVEPHVNQRFTFTTLIPEEFKFICVHATFHYDEATPHTVEKIIKIE
ncbi:hypothetical protein [Mariniflexile sp. AS56]|uniref:hypothetical protein n=1 Tax=Mariniflexile sp. AS56 TaxID=3063957 RepID=UPI0026EF6757|nr:hypothetical protein [Mariniflexile sp. AS56]MDO7174148.1 hypothetical protein [Mariniflexile sp. AS56]